jgi:hypothetical protein
MFITAAEIDIAPAALTIISAHGEAECVRVDIRTDLDGIAAERSWTCVGRRQFQLVKATLIEAGECRLRHHVARCGIE